MAAFRSTRGIGWVGGCLIVVVLGVAVIGGLGFFGVRTILKHGKTEIRAAIEGNAIVTQHVGEIELVEFNLDRSDAMLTGEEWDAGWTIWTVRGSKGEALAKMQFTGEERDDEGLPTVSDGILIKDGKEYPLFPEGVPDPKARGNGSGKPEETPVPEKPAESLPNPK